jgi:phosphoglucosamine mutase
MESINGQPVQSLVDDMTPERAQSVGALLGSVCLKVAVGRDANPSSQMIAAAFISGLTSAGADAVDAGIIPAPALCVAFRDRADCTVHVGSPDEYGRTAGLRIRLPEGSPFPLERLNGAQTELPAYDEVGDVRKDPEAIEQYIASFPEGDNGGYVIMDTGGNSTSVCAGRALKRAGADAVSINADIGEGAPSRSPGIDRAELAGLSSFVNASTGSIGIAFNGDGTRIAVMDESGKFVSGDKLLALMLIACRPTKAVVPYAAPNIVDDAFYKDRPEERKKHGLIRHGNTIESMLKTMKETGADFAGTLDGLFVFPKRTLCPDAIAAAADIARLAGSRSIRNVLEEFPQYAVKKAYVGFDGHFEAFRDRFTKTSVSYDVQDIEGGQGLCVTMSGGLFYVATDPADEKKIEITAESGDPVYLATILDQAEELVRSCV